MDNEMLIRSLAQVFGGVCGIFKSLEAGVDAPQKIAAEELPKVPTEAPPKASAEEPPKVADEDAPKASAEEPPKAAEEEPPKAIFTYDKILDIVGTKVQKQLEAGDKDINKRIKGLIVEMGYEKLPELPPELYEEFLTKLSGI